MNRENIQKVRDHIERLESGRFSMADWADQQELIHDCSTAGCIGGWTAALFDPEGAPEDNCDAAESALGLSSEEAMALFFPAGYAREKHFTQAAAVRVLDHLLETGEVRWDIIDAPSPSSDREGS